MGFLVLFIMPLMVSSAAMELPGSTKIETFAHPAGTMGLSESFFLFKAENVPFYVDTAFCISIHLLMDSGCFHILASVNNAAVNMDMQIPLQGPTISSLAIYAEFVESCGFRDGSVGKEPACNVGDLGLIPGLGRYPGEGNDYLLQYSGLENSMDRGAWGATVDGVTES